jgi:hypothetical protein
MEIRKLTLPEDWLTENIRSAVASYERITSSLTAEAHDKRSEDGSARSAEWTKEKINPEALIASYIVIIPSPGRKVGVNVFLTSSRFPGSIEC